MARSCSNAIQPSLATHWWSYWWWTAVAGNCDSSWQIDNVTSHRVERLWLRHTTSRYYSTSTHPPADNVRRRTHCIWFTSCNKRTVIARWKIYETKILKHRLGGDGAAASSAAAAAGGRAGGRSRRPGIDAPDEIHGPQMRRRLEPLGRQ